MEEEKHELIEELNDYIQEEMIEESWEEYEDIDIPENYIEINAEVAISFNDWIYDIIINKTLKEAKNDHSYGLIELLNESKRDTLGFLSLLNLEVRDFRMMCRYMNKAYKKSETQEKRVYIRKAHNQLVKQFQELLELMTRDERYNHF